MKAALDLPSQMGAYLLVSAILRGLARMPRHALRPCIFRPSLLSGDGLIEFDLSGGGQRLRCAPPRSVSEFRGQCVKPDTPMSMQLAG